MKKLVLILAILVVFMAFVYANGQEYASNSCAVTAPFYCNAWNAKTTGVTIELKNNGGETYNVTSVVITSCGTYSTLIAVATDAAVPITVTCSPVLTEGNTFKGDIIITYRKSGSTVDLTSTGSITQKVGNGENYKKNKTKTDFVPWQKRNESECPQNCSCHGAVISCPTENGKIMTIEAGRSGNIITIIVNKTEVNTTLELEQETNETTNKTKLKAKLSNGRKAEVKIMPDTASERALERLRLKVCSEENNCTIVLKEVGEGNETRLAYELQVKRHYRILGLFKAKAENRVEIDAENGGDSVKKPWWAFLAREIEE